MTITEGGALRGCVGHIAADRALGTVVRDMTLAAAQDDPRFPPIEPDELPRLALEISVLSELVPLGAAHVVAGRDGVLVRGASGKTGLLLPQVATEHHWSAEALLAAVCRKAGLPPDAWREPSTAVFAFQADVFGEPGTQGRGKRDE